MARYVILLGRSVRDHKADYPAGLPAPDIDPDLIYECGNTVAVRHVPGAQLTVFVNGGDPRTSNTSTGWSALFPENSLSIWEMNLLLV